MDNSIFDGDSFEFTLNNIPQERLSGLSPIQFFELTHNPFLQHSVVKFVKDPSQSTLDKVPFLRLAEAFANIIKRDGFVKLTPNGRIPVAVLREIYALGILPDRWIEIGINKLSSEDYWIIMTAVKETLKKGGITRIEKGRVVLVKKNLDYLKPENRENLFRLLYMHYSEDFNWAYFDGYPDAPVGQYGVSLTIYLLLKFGSEKRESTFYSKKYFSGYVKFAEIYHDPVSENSQHMCYSVRSFLRFTDWFGLTVTDENSISTDEVSATNLIHELFYIDADVPKYYDLN